MLSLCLLSSCTPHISQFPSIPPLEDGSHDDPARDAQSRLLREAYRAFVQERYQTAVLFFRRFVDGAQESPRLAEARWWLGRALEQLGDYPAAMEQYRIVASGQLPPQLNGSLYEGHALRRLDELRQLHADVNRTAKHVALRLRLGDLPSGPRLSTWLQEVSQAGVTALVVEAAQTQVSGRRVFDPERVKGVVTGAHNLGLLVWAELNIHQPMALDLKPEWLGLSVNGHANEAASIASPDIANPGYQAYLEETVRSLSRSGCDGLFLPARARSGFAGEFSDDSFRLFSASFGQDLSPEQVLAGRDKGDASAPERGLLYWRWVGWKALNSAKVMARLRAVLRETNPTAVVLLEVHQATLMTPLDGLEQYGEDVAELTQRTGGSIVVRRESEEVAGVIEKLARQLGTTERVWVEIPALMAGNPPSAAALKGAISNIIDRRHWHILLEPESPAVP